MMSLVISDDDKTGSIFLNYDPIVDYENNLNPDGIFFIYDTTNQQSFDDISKFI